VIAQSIAALFSASLWTTKQRVSRFLVWSSTALTVGWVDDNDHVI